MTVDFLSRYKDEEISQIWDIKSRYSYLYKVAITHFNFITKQDVSPSRSFDDVDIEDIAKIEQTTGHDINAFVLWLENLLEFRRIKHSNKIHYGLTSSDLIDTAFSMQIRDTNEIVCKKVDKLYLVIKYLEIPDNFLGRTHGQWAELISGDAKSFMMDNPLALLAKQIDDNSYSGKLSGSLGDNKYLSSRDEEEILHSLGLDDKWTQGQIISRVYYANLHHQWVNLASYLGKLATDLRLLTQPEIAEIRIKQPSGVNGSSSMPHKVNYTVLETITGLVALIQSHQNALYSIVNTWHERDIANSSVERIVWPIDANLLGYMLNKLTHVFKNLEFDQDKIVEHIGKASGSIYSQERMLELINSGKSRKEAYEEMKTSRK